MMEDRQFDELVKGLMENGTEEVPAGLWSAVESGLPAKVVPLWLKWAGSAAAAAAVAAAVTLAVVLPGRGTVANPIEIESASGALAEAAESDSGLLAMDASEGLAEDCGDRAGAVPSEIPAKADRAVKSCEDPSTTDIEPEQNVTPEQAAAQEHTVTPEQAAAQEHTVETEQAVEPKPADDATPSEMTIGAEDAEASGMTAAAEEGASFDEGGEVAKGRKASGFSLTLSGNATSNSNPKISTSSVRRSFRSADATAPASSTVVQTEESVFGVPLAFQLGFRYNFNQRWSIGSGFNFTILSRSFAGDYIKVDENSVTKSTEHYDNIRNNQVYFGVPVYAFCNIVTNRVIDFYAYAGGEMDKCIYNKYLLQSAEGKFRHEERYKGLQWSVKAGLGVEFIVTDELGIFVDPQVGWYFKTKKEYGNIWNYQPLMFGVNLGLRLRI